MENKKSDLSRSTIIFFMIISVLLISFSIFVFTLAISTMMAVPLIALSSFKNMAFLLPIGIAVCFLASGWAMYYGIYILIGCISEIVRYDNV